jgi:hypothetical protein
MSGIDKNCDLKPKGEEYPSHNVVDAIGIDYWRMNPVSGGLSLEVGFACLPLLDDDHVCIT